MKHFALFVMMTVSGLAQTTFNNLVVKTNLNLPIVRGSRGIVTDSASNVVSSTATSQQVNATAMQVATVAAMLALDTAQLNDGQLVTTSGRVASGDGGGAEFQWVSSSTETTNLITTFGLTGTGRFEWTRKNRYNIRMAGASGDVVGTTFNTSTNDSTVAIQATIDYALPRGIRVFFPYGNYVANTLAIDGVTFEFEGDQGPGYAGRRTTLWHRITPAATDDLLTARDTSKGRPVIYNGNFMGRAEQNRKTAYAITAATTSTFTISTNDAATVAASLTNALYNPTSAYPYYGYVSFFNSNSPIQRYIGQGLVQSIDVTTGVCTLLAGFTVQWVGQAGSDLVGGSVVFSKLGSETVGSLTTGTKPDPTRMGYCGLDVQGRLSTVKLYNCSFQGFSTGIRYGLALDVYAKNLYVTGCEFSCIGMGFPGIGSDLFMSGTTLLQGVYYRDVLYPNSDGSTSSIAAETWTPSSSTYEFRLCRSAFYGIPSSSEIDTGILNYFVWPLWLEGTTQVQVKSMTIDGTLRYSRLFGSANRLNIDDLKLRGALVNQGFQNLLSNDGYLQTDSGSKLWNKNISFENFTGTYTLGTGGINGTWCKKLYGLNLVSGSFLAYDDNVTQTVGYSTSLYSPSSVTATTILPNTTTTWILGALTAFTPATTTMTVTGARTGDKVTVAPSVLNGGTTLVSGAVTANDTVTLYASPTAAVVSGQTNTMYVKVLAQ